MAMQCDVIMAPSNHEPVNNKNMTGEDNLMGVSVKMLINMTVTRESVKMSINMTVRRECVKMSINNGSNNGKTFSFSCYNNKKNLNSISCVKGIHLCLRNNASF